MRVQLLFLLIMTIFWNQIATMGGLRTKDHFEDLARSLLEKHATVSQVDNMDPPPSRFYEEAVHRRNQPPNVEWKWEEQEEEEETKKIDTRKVKQERIEAKDGWALAIGIMDFTMYYLIIIGAVKLWKYMRPDSKEFEAPHRRRISISEDSDSSSDETESTTDWSDESGFEFTSESEASSESDDEDGEISEHEKVARILLQRIIDLERNSSRQQVILGVVVVVLLGLCILFCWTVSENRTNIEELLERVVVTVITEDPNRDDN